MFEPWESLVGKTHYKQDNPSEDLGVTVSVDVKNRDGGEASFQPYRDKQQRAPHSASRQRRGNASFEKATIDRVSCARFLRDGNYVWTFSCPLQFMQQRI